MPSSSVKGSQRPWENLEPERKPAGGPLRGSRICFRQLPVRREACESEHRAHPHCASFEMLPGRGFIGPESEARLSASELKGFQKALLEVSSQHLDLQKLKQLMP